MTARVLIIGCGAIAHELVALQRRNQWAHVRIQCLPADLHNTPDQIPETVRKTLEKYSSSYAHIFLAYADCGTGGALDSVLEEYGVERLPGAHCYEFFTGSSLFSQLSEEEPGTFYLTDFLVQNFDRLVKKGLGLDRHPQLMSSYFGNYRSVTYLAQTHSEELLAMARQQAEYLGLEFRQQHTGLAPLNLVLKAQSESWLSD